jgi:hypothetical protein
MSLVSQVERLFLSGSKLGLTEAPALAAMLRAAPQGLVHLDLRNK